MNSYVEFLENTDEGKIYLQSENLNVEELRSHLDIIKKIILSYSASIVEIIDGNVRWEQIGEKLSGFIDWVLTQVNEDNQVDFFTLNFDLLLETILLKVVGTDRITDFHVRRGYEAGVEKFNFSPQDNLLDFGRRKVRLHHLHGSLSSFKRLEDGRVFKLKTEDIRLKDFYRTLDTSKYFPSIITGGYKSAKIQMSPFNYYYNEFKVKMMDPDDICDELYIIGYSFRDEHINEAIIERLKLSRSTGAKRRLLNRLVIVDFKAEEADKIEFVNFVNEALNLKSDRTKLSIEKGDFLFGGADSIL